MDDARKIFFSMKALVFYDNRILLVKDNTGGHCTWELPGGRLEFGETPEETLRRELMEETGMEIQVIQPLSTWHYLKNDNIYLVGIISLCKAGTDKVRLSPEHNEYAWVPIEDIEKFNIHPALYREMKKWNWNNIAGCIK